MIGIILIFGVPVVVALAIISTIELIKKIKQNYKINKAIKELGDQDPYDVLCNTDDFAVTHADKSTLQDAIKTENTEYNRLGFFGKINHFFFGEEKESSRLAKQIYKEKKEAIETENYNDDLGQLEKNLNKEDLSRAKSAYRILKSKNGRAKYTEALNKRPSTLPSSTETESNPNATSENTLNTAKEKRTGEYTFKINTTPLQRFMMLFKGGNKQYMPSQLSVKHMNIAQLHNQG